MSQPRTQPNCPRRSRVERQHFAGCYALRLGRWWPWGIGDDAQFVTPPAEFELKAERGTERFEKGELLIRGTLSTPPWHRSSFWVPRNGRNVLLVWTNGLSGVSLNLKKTGSDVRGWAHAHFDFPTPPYMAHVVARPITCRSAN